MPDGGIRTKLAPPFAVGASVLSCGETFSANAPHNPAGAEEPVTDPADGVTSDPAALNTDSDTADSDRVKHFAWLRAQGEKHYLPQPEFERQRRLARWQRLDR